MTRTVLSWVVAVGVVPAAAVLLSASAPSLPADSAAKRAFPAPAPRFPEPAGPMIRFPFDAGAAARLRTDWAKATGLPESVDNSVGMRLALIPGGRFEMGPNGSRHRVTLALAFHLGIHEVTNAQYRRFRPDHRVAGSASEFEADDVPVAGVSWNDARAFCEWLSEQPAEKAAGRRYALPTEAQWEWAARAGTATSRHFGETDKGQTDHSVFNHTYTANPKSESDGRGRKPVGGRKPNAWGLHDMLGNVWEWTADRHVDAATGESRDPSMRGGGWRSGAFHCTAVAHDPGGADQRADHIGFRVACRIATPTGK